MLRNYFLITLRQLRKQKMYTVIKIGGFALSIAACILITLFILDELSYDTHYAHPDRTYRVAMLYKGPPNPGAGTDHPAPFAAALREDFPEVEEIGRIMPNPLFNLAGSNQVRRADQEVNTYEEGFTYADQSFLNVLGFPMIYGIQGHALDEPNTIVMTRRKAEKYFPNQNPVGRILYLNNDKKRPFTVTGVIGDFASSTSIQFDFYISLKGVSFWNGEQQYWGANNYETYVLLKPGTDPVALEKKAEDVEFRKHVIPAMMDYGDKQKDAERKAKDMGYYFQPVKDIYLRTTDRNIGDDLPSHGDIRLVWMFGGIALFILVIACINFVNLATAKSANRAKEVGLRKVIGSGRPALIRQFLAESLVYSFLSFVLAVLLAWLLLPLFNTLTEKSLVMPFATWWFGPMMVVSIFMIGLVAGVYPAFYLSAFKPAKVLKGQIAKGSRNAGLRSVLVVFQFTTSIILIIGTFVLYKQMQYVLHKKVGFDKDQVLVVQGTDAIPNIQSFKNDLLTLSQVKSVAIGDYLPVNIPGAKGNGNGFYVYSKRKETPPVFGQFWIADYDYIPTMGMKLVEGRNFSRDMAGDTATAVINQAMVKQLGLGPHPLGSVITNGNGPLTVIGVVEDFYFDNVKRDVGSLCLFLGISPSLVSIKVKSADVGNLIPQVSSIWKKYVPNQSLRYTFLDEGFKHMYADVDRASKLLTCFTILAIVVACLGLFALSSFMAEQRTKEIGIRKVLGASVGQLLLLLSKDFVILIVISIVIAAPLAWYGIHAWLQSLVYRPQISIWIFVGVGFVALAIALLTTGFQSVKTALDNPIKSLKSE
jgi:putative ABC transport system permease protein